jgi:7-cyano-7-deazaguanine synthase in queuosine biosynthesis
MKKKSQKEIWQIINNRKLENPEIIRLVENILRKNSQGIFLNKIEGKVVLLISGGMDSVIVWAYLLKEKVHVYPVFFNRGQRRAAIEKSSVQYFERLYKKKYLKYWHPVKYINAFNPPKEIRFPITISSNEIVNAKKGQKRGIPVYTNMLFSVAVQYAYYLEITTGVKVRTVIGAFMASDGWGIGDETLTAMRSINMTVCALTHDYSWRTIALPIEKDLGYFFDKEDFIKWAIIEKIPLEKTRSCIMWGKSHCGKCISCVARQNAFRRAGILDKTKYKTARNMKEAVKYHLKTVLIKLGII